MALRSPSGDARLSSRHSFRRFKDFQARPAARQAREDRFGRHSRRQRRSFSGAHISGGPLDQTGGTVATWTICRDHLEREEMTFGVAAAERVQPFNFRILPSMPRIELAGDLKHGDAAFLRGQGLDPKFLADQPRPANFAYLARCAMLSRHSSSMRSWSTCPRRQEPLKENQWTVLSFGAELRGAQGI